MYLAGEVLLGVARLVGVLFGFLCKGGLFECIFFVPSSRLVLNAQGEDVLSGLNQHESTTKR